MKKIILSAFAALFLVGSAFAETVRMGTEGAYPPYNFINDNGEVDGFEKDVGDMLCIRANLDCVWVINEWDSIIPNLVSGNYDTIIAGMSITAERDEVIDFTQDYFPPSPSVYMGMSGADIDVDSAVIAAQTATIQAGYVAESGATLVEFANIGEVSIGGGVGMGIRESDIELKAKMNAAISSMKDDGSLNALIK